MNSQVRYYLRRIGCGPIRRSNAATGRAFALVEGRKVSPFLPRAAGADAATPLGRLHLRMANAIVGEVRNP